MKFKFVVLLAATLSIAACKKEKQGTEKEETTKTDPNNNPDPNTVPDTFTKRVVVEKFTGEWCGYCPGGNKEMKRINDIYGDQMILVDLHGGDPMETTHTNYLSNGSMRYNVQYYPSAVIDRKKSNDYTDGSPSWEADIDASVNQTAKLGIRLQTEIDDNGLLDIKAKVVSNEAISSAYITLYLVEDNVPQSSPNAQADYTGDAGPNYIHQHVLRRVLTSSPHGEALNIAEARVEYLKEYNDIDISAYNSANLKVVAIVEDYVFNQNLQSYNAKQVAVGESTDWN